jgi:hypothetical protein
VSAVVAARAAGEAIGELNHPTLGPDGFEVPSDVDAVIGELGLLVQRLPQAFHQAGVWLQVQHGTGRLGHDLGSDGPASVIEVLGEVLGVLHHAGHQAQELALTLETAHSVTSHLTGVDPRAGAR